MLGKLKEMFASASPESGDRRSRVDIRKRFFIESDVSSQGSMSKVYKARDTETGRNVCLKVQDRERNEAAMARASRHEGRPSEGAVALSIRHPNVVRTYEYGMTTKGEEYIVMEYLEGLNFEEIQERRLGRTAQKLEWLAQAADGLDAVHQAGYIHHDVNPRNFLVCRNADRQAKVIDFGLTIPNTPAFRKPGNRTGCLLYMAPELIRREAIDERIDVYSFGVVAFGLLTGKHPFDVPASPNALLQRFRTPPDDPLSIKPRLSDEVRDLLLQLIAVDRRDRRTDLKGLAAEFRAIPPKRPAN